MNDYICASMMDTIPCSGTLGLKSVRGGGRYHPQDRWVMPVCIELYRRRFWRSRTDMYGDVVLGIAASILRLSRRYRSVRKQKCFGFSLLK